MTIDTQKLLSIFDTAAQTYGWAGGTGTVGQFQTALTNYQKARGDLEQALDAQTAEIARLREILGSIRQYGNDTLSGRADGGPDDRKWQREAVIEMRNRASAALSGESNG